MAKRITTARGRAIASLEMKIKRKKELIKIVTAEVKVDEKALKELKKKPTKKS